MPKLMVVCVQYTACVLVADGEGTDVLKDALDAVVTTIRAVDGQGEPLLAPADKVALEPKHERDLPFDWKDQMPFVSSSVSDADFAKWAQTADGENLNVLEIFKSLHTKD